MPEANVEPDCSSTADANVVEDIEDIFRSAETLDDFQFERAGGRKYVLPRVRRRRRTDDINGGSNAALQRSLMTFPDPIVCDSVIPGTHRIHVRTWGCAHNSSDSEYMAGQLAAFGYTLVDDKRDADLWLLNSCTVKNPAEDHFRNEIMSAKKLGKHVVVAGCVAQSVPSIGYLGGLSIVGVQQIDRIVEVVEETLKGNTVRLLSKKKLQGRKTGGASLALPKIRRNNLIEIIPISTGCLNHCTYCKTKHARGELGSYPVDDLVDRAKQAFNEGVCELWITSEDTGAYGIDIGSSLPELLWRLVAVIPDGCMLRLGMTNPPYILQHLDEMAKILAHPKVYSFLHVPVQSGSDYVLADMKREYCVADFENVVDFLRERVPGLTVATDIICGFPTESEENFRETMTLVEKYKFPSLFINQFFPRPGTAAGKMMRIPSHDVKKRTKAVSELFASYSPYDHKVGETQSVLVTELSTDNNHYIGHNKFYEQVLVPKDDALLGHVVRVKITSTGKHFLMGEPHPEEYGPPVRPTVVNLIQSTSSSKRNESCMWLTWLDWPTIAVLGLFVCYVLCKLAPLYWS